MRCSSLAVRTNALVGTQPWLVHVPPKWFASASRRRELPRPAPANAASEPAAPPPTITRSYAGLVVLGLFRSHRDVAVQRGTVFDSEPAHLDLAVQAARAAERKSLSCRHVAVDLAPYVDVGPFDRGLHVGGRVDEDVA